jgi:hypothetical protein
MPISAEATRPAAPATVAEAAVAGPAASGPMIGERKPNTPAKVSAADDMIDRIIVAACVARETAAPACSAPVRAATPAVVAAVLAASLARCWITIVSPHSMNLIRRSVRIFLKAVCQLVVPVIRPRNWELKLCEIVLPKLSYCFSCVVIDFWTRSST